MNEPIVVSGIQPTGRLHLGNYLGALRNFVELQNSGKFRGFFFIADYHALTEDTGDDFAAQVLDLQANFLAAGLNPKKSVLFTQSDIAEHTNLAWILSTVTPFGELSRMTQFKDKSEKQPGNVNAGLFTYPVLMAADILIYDADAVPVGEDQDQHLELTRTLARRFNARFHELLKEPKGIHTPTPRVMSFSDPERKMSKSEPAGCLFLDDSPETIMKKTKTAVTDSGSEVRFDPVGKPAVSNLLTIFSTLSGTPIQELERTFSGRGYADFKYELGQTIVKTLEPFRAAKAKLLKDPKSIEKAFAAGSKTAKKIATAKMTAVMKTVYS